MSEVLLHLSEEQLPLQPLSPIAINQQPLSLPLPRKNSSPCYRTVRRIWDTYNTNLTGGVSMQM